MGRAIEINGVVFEPRDDCNYRHDYVALVDKIESGQWDKLEAFQELILNDLFFITYFVLQIPINDPFWVDACNEVQDGPESHTLDVWAREHGKSTIITTAEVIQKVLRNPERRVAIFSYCKTAAVKLFLPIKQMFEKSELLKACFPDILYNEPSREAERWSEDRGIILKRRGNYREATIEPHGLIEGMPTGSHFTDRVYDDIMTDDFKNSAEMIDRVKRAYDMSIPLGVDGGTVRAIGTFYHHMDVLVYLMNQKDEDGKPTFTLRCKPGTEGGEYNGSPVFMSYRRLAEYKTDPDVFATQILCNPTPMKLRKLSSKLLQVISLKDLPKRLYRFMVVDPAGERKRGSGDCWAIIVFGVEPYRDELGASNFFILDMFLDRLPEAEAPAKVVEIYLRNGRILALGVEKVGQSTAELHIKNALLAKGKRISEEDGTLKILTPAGREKAKRIMDNLGWPLNNGKMFILDTIPQECRDRLTTQMDKFPFYHDDGPDGLSYGYDMIKNYNFPKRPPEETLERRTLWQRISQTERRQGWMAA